MTEGKKAVSASIDADLYQALYDRAEAEERTMGVIVRRALRAYLEDGVPEDPMVNTAVVETFADPDA